MERSCIGGQRRCIVVEHPCIGHNAGVLLWNVAALEGNAGVLLWNVAALEGNAGVLLWNVAALVGNVLALLWNALALLWNAPTQRRNTTRSTIHVACASRNIPRQVRNAANSSAVFMTFVGFVGEPAAFFADFGLRHGSWLALQSWHAHGSLMRSTYSSPTQVVARPPGG